MSVWDFRQDLRPLLGGNVTIGAFTIVVLTRLFNVFQKQRRGAAFPAKFVTSQDSTPKADLCLQPGERVRVRSASEIGATLGSDGKNRGLWFDREMVRHCGSTHEVERRVTNIIDDASGKMIRMRTPCIVLKSVDSCGEYLRLCAQHDEPFWRECWLTREGPDPALASDDGQKATEEG